MSDKPVPQAEWESIVSHVPLVSVDLVVEHPDGVLLGKRSNGPAKGEWFVPGGTVQKHESLTEALHRVAKDELGLAVSIQEQLGVYEHFYDVADVDDADGKHYVPIGYHVTIEGDSVDIDSQHDSLRTFSPPFEGLDLHPYVRAYLLDAGFDIE
jgi:colanic acid biosynthesis protein WcaH